MTMQNVTMAYNNFLYGLSNTSITGQLGRVHILLHMFWPWLTLPSLIIKLGAISLFVTMYERRRLGAHVWTISELALLFHPITGTCLSETGAYSNLETVSRRQKSCG